MSRKRDHEVPGGILDRFAASEASEEERRQVLRHLLAGCPSCLRHLRLAGWHSEDQEARSGRSNVIPLGPPAGRYDAAFAAAERAMNGALDREHIPVRDLLAELGRMSPGEREFKVRNLQRYGEGELALALVEKSFELRYSDTAAMLHYAGLAVAAAEKATPETSGGRSLLADCRARAWAQLGNSHRIKTELHEAERCFSTSLAWLEEGCGEPEPRAWILLRFGSLRIAQRNFHESARLQEESASLYRKLSDRSGEADALISIALSHIAACDPQPAIAPLQRALEILNPWHPREEQLIRGAAINLVLCYVDIGRPQAAYDTATMAEPYFEDCRDTLARLRWTWQRGNVDRERGDFFSAEERLSRVREGFELEGLAEELAEVSLDLAMVYARQGRRAEFLGTIAEAAAIFQALGTTRELLGALGQLQAMADEREAAAIGLRQLLLRCRGGIPRAER